MEWNHESVFTRIAAEEGVSEEEIRNRIMEALNAARENADKETGKLLDFCGLPDSDVADIVTLLSAYIISGNHESGAGQE